jgi:hypothetical protein
MTTNPDKSEMFREMELWWLDKAQVEIERTVPKAVEYGADDLDEIGRDLIKAGVANWHGDADENLRKYEAELGVYFYMVGKMARWRSAIRRGESVSDDTLFDIGVYVRMVQRIRDAGSWPGVQQPDPTLFDDKEEDPFS